MPGHYDGKKMKSKKAYTMSGRKRNKGWKKKTNKKTKKDDIWSRF